MPSGGKEHTPIKNVEDNIVVFDKNNIMDKCSTPKEEGEKDNQGHNKEEVLSCTLCKYKCKK